MFYPDFFKPLKFFKDGFNKLIIDKNLITVKRSSWTRCNSLLYLWHYQFPLIVFPLRRSKINIYFLFDDISILSPNCGRHFLGIKVGHSHKSLLI